MASRTSRTSTEATHRGRYMIIWSTGAQWWSQQEDCAPGLADASGAHFVGFATVPYRGLRLRRTTRAQQQYPPVFSRWFVIVKYLSSVSTNFKLRQMIKWHGAPAVTNSATVFFNYHRFSNKKLVIVIVDQGLFIFPEKIRDVHLMRIFYFIWWTKPPDGHSISRFINIGKYENSSNLVLWNRMHYSRTFLQYV